MTNKNSKHLILAIETAVLGGSISLLRDGNQVDSIAGEKDVSRSEDILVNIRDLLERNGVGAQDVNLIAVSTGPGSYTGIRVGIATAIGLKNALQIDCVGVGVLGSMAMAADLSADVLCALPIGRDEVCWQSFGPSVRGTIQVEKQDIFIERVREGRNIPAVLHEKLFVVLRSEAPSGKIVNAGNGLAKYIGMAAFKREAIGLLEPIYVRDNI